MKETNYQAKASKNKNRINISTGILYAFGFSGIVYFKIHGPREVSTHMMVHDICHVVVLFICAILIGIIKYNVKRNRMFIKTNAKPQSLSAVALFFCGSSNYRSQHDSFFYMCVCLLVLSAYQHRRCKRFGFNP